MFVKINILAFFLLIKFILSLKSNDFCNLNNMKTCQVKTKYSFLCDKNKCTTNEETCIRYLEIKLFVAVDDYKRRVLKSEKSKKFELFNKNILNCSHTPNSQVVQYSLKASKDLCKTGLVCYEKQSIPMRSGNINYTKKIACKCTGNLNYQCGLYMCTIHKRACDEFNKMSLNQKNITIRSVPNCKN